MPMSSCARSSTTTSGPPPPGDRGELVLTPLGRHGWPVLRYRTGDVVIARRHAAARPATTHPWLPGGIVGRTDDMVVIRGMNVYPSAIEQAVRDAAGSGEFRLTFYTEPSGMDEVKLEVELSRGATARTLQDVMRQQLGLRVRVVPVGSGRSAAHRGQGKTRGGRAMSAMPRRARASAGRASRSPRRSSTTSSARGSRPGDFLGREEDLAAEFGVSRPTLREALKLLASGNLIRATKGPGGGIFVARTADAGHEPQSLGRDRDDARDTRRYRSRSCSRRGCCSRSRSPGRRPTTRRPTTSARCGPRSPRQATAAEADDLAALRPPIAALHRHVASMAGNRMVRAFTAWVFEVLQPSLMRGRRPVPIVHSAVVDQHEALDRPRSRRATRRAPSAR